MEILKNIGAGLLVLAFLTIALLSVVFGLLCIVGLVISLCTNSSALIAAITVFGVIATFHIGKEFRQLPK